MPTPNEPNDKFREVRESTESPTHPGYSLTRQELAELVNAWIWEHHHKPEDKPIELDRNYIGKLEQGFILWPGALYREAFRAVLGVASDAELGFVNTLSRRAAVKLDTVHKVKRQQFHTATFGGVVSGLLLAKPLTELLEGIGADPTPPPTRVGASDVAQIRAATREFRSWGNTYGGGLVREIVMAQLRCSARLLNASCPDRLLPELHAVLGELAEVAGYLALDAGAQQEARRVFSFALACAEQAKDWNLRAKILSNMAAQAVWVGQPDEGLTLAEWALVRADWLTPAGRALLQTDRACALAKMRRVQETLRAIGTADEHFAHVTPDNEPSSTADYTDTRHALFTGRRLVDLAILGHDPGEATNRLTAAAAGLPEGPYPLPSDLPDQSFQPHHGHRRPAARRHHRTPGPGPGRRPPLAPHHRGAAGAVPARRQAPGPGGGRRAAAANPHPDQHPPSQHPSPGPSPDPPAGPGLGLSRQH